jgi:subtilisin family serine protease
MKKLRTLVSIAMVVCMLLSATITLPIYVAAEEAEYLPDYVENEILIQTDNTIYNSENYAAAEVYTMMSQKIADYVGVGVSVSSFCSVDETSNACVVSLSNINNTDLSILDLCDDINDDNISMHAEPNYIFEFTEESSLDTGLNFEEFEPMDTLILGGPSNWHLKDTFATEAYGFCENKGDGVLVAVIDTGCNFEHEHLQNSMITFTVGPDTLHGYNVTGTDYAFNITDNYGHGTAVSSVISGSNPTNNVTGVAYNSKILPIKASNDGTITEAMVLRAIDKIKEYNNEVVGNFPGAEQKVSVINMSFARVGSAYLKYYKSTLRDSLDSISKECIIVAAAGNKNTNTMSEAYYPASFDSVIGVMAYDPSRTMAHYSNYDQRGHHYNIAAPGSSITVATHLANNGYKISSGTSLASPIVAGAIALYMSNCPNSTIATVKSNLLGSSTDKVKPFYGDDIEHNKLNIVSFLNKGLLTEQSVFSGSCGYNATWTYTHSNRSLTITGVDEIDDCARGSAPWYRFRDLITTCDISDDIYYIGNYSFADLSALANLDMGSGIEYIGDLAFAYCKSLHTLNMPNNEIEITLGSFFGCNSLTNITLPQSLYSPSNCSYLFQNCTALESIIIPTGWTILPSGMFFGCTSLSSVTLPNTIQRIDAVAFKNCYNLENLELPESLVEFRPRVFENCTGFISLEMPRSLTKIGLNVFAGCSNLESVTLYDNTNTIRNNVFKDCPQLTIKAYAKSVAYYYAIEKNIDCDTMYRLNPSEGSGLAVYRTVGSPDDTTGIVTGQIDIGSSVPINVFTEQYIELEPGFTLDIETDTTGYITVGTIVKVLNGTVERERYTII